ncbi:hypothetical protein Leryth_014193 [Lithospermum erythrorhizon]|nr:hypothetical protein Leryth_014193 [Lithospermum erythrorhizon]
MSLNLLQSYSSAEEEEEQYELSSSDDDEDGGAAVSRRRYVSNNKPLFDPNPPPSSLPSALDAFSEVSGPPQFLNNAVEEATKDGEEPQFRHGRKNRSRDKKDLPTGAVLESKPQLIGIHERVRSDVGAGTAAQPTTTATTQGVKRVATVTNPSAEDASELLRICTRCGIPKTYTNGKGIVCPVCVDRPQTDEDSEAAKKKGTVIKDKEKLKRMKGQSSHASWKSETEMQLRQQFD